MWTKLLKWLKKLLRFNKKGVVETLVVLYVVLAFIGGVILWKPATNLLGIGNQPQKQKAAMVKKSEATPVLYYRDEKGNEHVAMATKTFESTLDTSEDRVMTFWQKFKLWIVLLGIAIIMFPSFGVWLFQRFRRAKDNFQELVTGIEEAKKTLPPEAIATLESNLSKKMDADTKLLVKKVKIKL